MEDTRRCNWKRACDSACVTDHSEAIPVTVNHEGHEGTQGKIAKIAEIEESWPNLKSLTLINKGMTLANIGHSGWLKTTNFCRWTRIAKQNQHILWRKMARYVLHYPAQPNVFGRLCLNHNLVPEATFEGFAILERHPEIHKTNSCR
jgi:hypothetical protein